MECARAREQIGPGLDGELDPQRAASLAAHLDCCSACRVEEEALRAVSCAVRRGGNLEPPTELWARIEDQACGLQVSLARTAGLRFWLPRVAAVFVGALFTWGAYAITSPDEPRSSDRLTAATEASPAAPMDLLAGDGLLTAGQAHSPEEKLLAWIGSRGGHR